MAIEKQYISGWRLRKKQPWQIIDQVKALETLEKGDEFTGLAILQDGKYLGWIEYGYATHNHTWDIRVKFFDDNYLKTHTFFFSSKPESNVLNIYQSDFILSESTRKKLNWEENFLFDLVRGNYIKRVLVGDSAEESIIRYFKLEDVKVKDYPYDFDTLENLFITMMPYNFDNPPYVIGEEVTGTMEFDF